MCMYKCMCIHVHVQMHVYPCVCMYVYVHMYIQVNDQITRRTIDKWINVCEDFLGRSRAIAELTKFVRPRGPNSAVLFQHHAVQSTRSNSLCASTHHLHEHCTVTH